MISSIAMPAMTVPSEASLTCGADYSWQCALPDQQLSANGVIIGEFVAPLLQETLFATESNSRCYPNGSGNDFRLVC